MAMALLNLKMEASIGVSFRWGNLMDRGSSCGLMDPCMRENIRRVRDMGREGSFLNPEITMKDFGERGSNMGMAHYLIKMDK